MQQQPDLAVVTAAQVMFHAPVIVDTPEMDTHAQRPRPGGDHRRHVQMENVIRHLLVVV